MRNNCLVKLAITCGHSPRPPPCCPGPAGTRWDLAETSMSGLMALRGRRSRWCGSAAFGARPRREGPSRHRWVCRLCGPASAQPAPSLGAFGNRAIAAGWWTGAASPSSGSWPGGAPWAQHAFSQAWTLSSLSHGATALDLRGRLFLGKAWGELCLFRSSVTGSLLSGVPPKGGSGNCSRSRAEREAGTPHWGLGAGFCPGLRRAGRIDRGARVSSRRSLPLTWASVLGSAPVPVPALPGDRGQSPSPSALVRAVREPLLP